MDAVITGSDSNIAIFNEYETFAGVGFVGRFDAVTFRNNINWIFATNAIVCSGNVVGAAVKF